MLYSESDKPQKEVVGFIGLGNMGTPMARNLNKWLVENNLAPLTLWNRTGSKIDEFKSLGCTSAATIEEIGEKCDVIFTSLANDEVAKEVYAKLFTSSEKRLSQHRGSQTIFIETSTLYPTVCGKLEHQSGSIPHRHFLSCPVFGPPGLAETAQLLAVISGDYVARKYALQFVVPSMARKAIDVGSNVERAASFKLIGNSVVLGIIELLAESMTLADKSGVGAETLYELIKEFFPAPSFLAYGKKILNDEFHSDVGFTLSGGIKDASHIRRLAESVNTPVPIIDIAHQHLVTAKASGGGAMDWCSLVGGQRIASGQAPFKRKPHFTGASTPVIDDGDD